MNSNTELIRLLRFDMQPLEKIMKSWIELFKVFLDCKYFFSCYVGVNFTRTLSHCETVP